MKKLAKLALLSAFLAFSANAMASSCPSNIEYKMRTLADKVGRNVAAR